MRYDYSRVDKDVYYTTDGMPPHCRQMLVRRLGNIKLGFRK
jgi:hypothetical protein